MNSTVDHLVLHVRKRGSMSSPIYLSLCCRSSYSLTCHCVTSSLRLLLFSFGACHSLYFSITFTSFDALLLVSGCGSLATVSSTVCCFACYLSPVAYLRYSLFLLWTWSKPNLTALKWRHCCQSLHIKHKILYEYKNVKIKENEDIMFGHFFSRVYNITRKLIWDNHHHFYSLLSNTLPMACHTTLKMVKSRTHASMFLWFTTAEFLCNDSRLSECGKSETYCWNSPNVSRGISGFSSSDFQLLVKCECFFHNAFVLLCKKNVIFSSLGTLAHWFFIPSACALLRSYWDAGIWCSSNDHLGLVPMLKWLHWVYLNHWTQLCMCRWCFCSNL